MLPAVACMALSLLLLDHQHMHVLSDQQVSFWFHIFVQEL